MQPITATYTVADMTAFNRMANKLYPNKRANKFRIFYGIAGVFGIFAGTMAFLEGSNLLVACGCIAIGVVYILACILHYRIMGAQTQASRPKDVNSMTFTFDSMGLLVENTNGHGRFSPSDIDYITESKQLFALFVKENRQGFVIPKRYVEDCDAFRAMVQEKFPCEYTEFSY